jgi:hypothetical protein
VPDEPDPRIELVWTQTQAQLAARMAAVDELRARVGVLISGAAIATGFLAGQALNAKHGIPMGAWLGIAAAGALILACAYILLPREWASQVVDAKIQLRYIDDRPTKPVDGFRRYMIDHAAEHLLTDERRLDRLYRVFSFSLACLVVDFAGWIWALAAR